MRKVALAGALALAMGVSSALAQSESVTTVAVQPTVAGPAVQEAHIAQLKAALQLKPEQYGRWAAVEGALRSLARAQRTEASGGIVQRVSARATSIASAAVQLRRVAAAASPLIKTLDETQKRDGAALIRRLGYASLASSF